MGPPPFGDGKSEYPPATRMSPFTLQWGHRLSAMERWMNPPGGAGYGWLQWGHRLSAMERVRQLTQELQILTLQWGHRLSAMESCVRLSQPLGRPPRFNGATAFRRWKVDNVEPTEDDWLMLQWGHRLSAMERMGQSTAHTGRATMLQWGHRLSAMERSSWSGRCPD